MKEKLKSRQLCVQKASRNGTAARFVQSMANVPVAQVRSQQLETLVDNDVLLNVAVGRKTFVDESSAVVEWCQRTPGGALVAGIRSRTSIASFALPEVMQRAESLLPTYSVSLPSSAVAPKACDMR